MLSLAAFLLGSAQATLNFSQFRGDKVFRFHGSQEAVTQIHKDLELMDFWHVHDIRAAPSEVPALLEYFEAHNLTYKVHITDVEKHFAESMVPAPSADPNDEPFFDEYRTYPEYIEYMTQLQNDYNGVNGMSVLLDTLPDRTYENNQIFYMGVTGQGGFNNDKKRVFWNGCIHAREWISCSTMMYGLTAFMEAYANGDEEVTAYLNSISLYVVPVVNVDGFLYTWSDNRNWRKTRSPQGVCYGVDPNRNWDTSGWGTVGGSNTACSDTYFGPDPFSEGCVVAISNFLKTMEFTQFVDWHTYGNMFFSSYGYTCDLPPAADYALQYQMDEEVALTIASVYGTSWTYGTICNTIYAVGGGSTDWNYLQNRIVQSFGAELAGNSFSPPTSTIRPAGEETYAGMKVLLDYAMKA